MNLSVIFICIFKGILITYSFEYDPLERLANSLHYLNATLANNLEEKDIYDLNGNMTYDATSGLTMEWNDLNLIKKVSDGNGMLVNYSYLADGKGLEYRGSLTFRRSQNGGTGQVVETNDYYAFGGRWDRSGSLVDQSNRYRNNDKEEQATFGTPYSDYGARQYSSASGRWLAVDPLAEKYYGISPYAFCNNNPVNFVDPDGLSPSNCISNIIVMIHINHIFSPDAFPESKQISETDFYYYYYTGDLSFEFDDGKISVRYVTLGDVCAQLRDICLELETERNVKRMLEFTEGEGIITFERQDETIFIHPDFIPSENSSYVSAAPEDYGFYVTFNEFYNEVKRFYSCVAAVIWASDSHTKNYLTEWE